MAENEADAIVWDGAGDDLPFVRPNFLLTLADAMRPGHETTYHPGEANLRRADAVLVMKVDAARPTERRAVDAAVVDANPKALILHGDLRLLIDQPERLNAKRAVVVEDGHTVTSGGMPFGAGALAADAYGATIVDAEPCAVGTIRDAYRDFPQLRRVVPALGYSQQQMDELRDTLNGCRADLIIDATPVNLKRILDLELPVVDVDYEFVDIGDGVQRLLSQFASMYLTKAKTPVPR